MPFKEEKKWLKSRFSLVYFNRKKDSSIIYRYFQTAGTRGQSIQETVVTENYIPNHIFHFHFSFSFVS